MLPTKFSSSRSQGASNPKRSPEPSLVGLRYEKMVQAEPPKPIPPRNPSRLQPRPPSVRSATPSSPTLLPAAWCPPIPIHSPIIIAPPYLAPMITIAVPPAEQHPALRTPLQQARTAQEVWKRDSGHARTPTSPTTIPEEDDEDDCDYGASATWSTAVDKLIRAGMMSSAVAQHPDRQAIASVVPATSPSSVYDNDDDGAKAAMDDQDPRGPRAKWREEPLHHHHHHLHHRPSIAALASSAVTSLSLPSSSQHTPPRQQQGQAQEAPAPVTPVTPTKRTTLLQRFSNKRSPTQSAPRSRLTKGKSRMLASEGSPSRRPPIASAGAPPPAPSTPLKPQASRAPRYLDLQHTPTHRPPTTAAGAGPAGSGTATTGLHVPCTRSPAPTNSQLRPKSRSPHSLQPWHASPASPALTHKSHDASSPPVGDDKFKLLGLHISTPALVDDGFMAALSFSDRGSIMFGGSRLANLSVKGAATPPLPAAASPAAAVPAHHTAAAAAADHDEAIEPSRVGSTTAATTTRTTTTTTTTTTATTIPISTRISAPRTTIAPTTQTLPPGHRRSPFVATINDKPNLDDAAINSAIRRVSSPPPPLLRVQCVDADKESQKVRSLYGVGDAMHWEDGVRCLSSCGPLSPTPEAPSENDWNDSTRHDARAPGKAVSQSQGSFVSRNDAKSETELAGGLEDWQDVDGADVDRYGFIAVPRVSSPVQTPGDPGLSSSPRRRNILYKKELMGLGVRRPPSRKVSARSLNTVNSGMSMASMRSSRSVIRQAGNLLPHNRDRRWMDEAGDMLTLSPNLQDAAEEAEIERISEALKRKEWERSEKWRKMAKVVRRGGQGEGMEFEFDMKNPKLIERTWKGIPDRWRATAWWSFLSTSAQEHGGVSAQEIIASFHRLLEQASPDDVQIDLDVPRTISRHIMFRRRYRGGQRLLFRVLHALSIYFPETGYVQGMASLAATLLCYFDEERCFVMLVRMWQLRGLNYLYRPGFEGLMTALKEFHETWLNKDVAKKLTELSVDVTAYGTRWYLTLFNLSIPFPAQLRVWDVFLLLGESTPAAPPPTATSATRPTTMSTQTPSITTTIISGGSRWSKPGPTSGLDVLHSTSAALVQALSEVLLDSDFENAMKSLTSWIPIKDEDLLMKVTKAEWKSHRGKRKT